jgi:hypothetical protein
MACKAKGYSDKWQKTPSPTVLVSLALEASQIAASAYFGVSNKNAGDYYDFSSSVFQDTWLQLIGPWVIKDME